MINKYQTELNECGDQPKVPYKHEIKVVDDRSVCSPARRLPYIQWEEIEKQIDTLLEKYIVPSTCLYASPILTVLKKDGSIIEN